MAALVAKINPSITMPEMTLTFQMCALRQRVGDILKFIGKQYSLNFSKLRDLKPDKLMQ